MVASTSASSGPMTSSRSSSVLDGAICSSGMSSPVAGSRYWMRLCWDNSPSSSIRMPVSRSTSTAAQVQNARCSSQARSRLGPPAGSCAHGWVACLALTAHRCSAWPPVVNSWPGAAARHALSRSAAASRSLVTWADSIGRTGIRSRVRWSIRALRCRRWRSAPTCSARTGGRAAHGPQRPGSSIAHSLMSR